MAGLEVGINFLITTSCTILYVIVFTIFYRLFGKDKSPLMRLLLEISIFTFPLMILDIVNVFFDNILLAEGISFILMIILVCFVILGDFFTRDSMDLRKTALVSGGLGCLFIYQMELGLGYPSFGPESPIFWINTIILLLIVIFGYLTFVRTCFLVHKFAPPQMRSSANWILAAGFVSIITVPLIFIPVQVPIPEGTITIMLEYVPTALAWLFFALGIHQNPGVIYVLPFKAIRLTVLSTDSGIQLFSHTWQSGGHIVNEDLFTGMLQGINVIVQESVNRGEIRELLLENAVFIFRRNAQYPIAFVLVTSKSSRVLRESLQAFGAEFITIFEKDLARPNMSDTFNGATELIKKYFPYLS